MSDKWPDPQYVELGNSEVARHAVKCMDALAGLDPAALREFVEAAKVLAEQAEPFVETALPDLVPMFERALNKLERRA